MPWTIADDETRNAIAGAGEPPADLQTVSANDFWRWAFTQWPGAEQIWYQFALYNDLHDGVPMTAINDSYGAGDTFRTTGVDQLVSDVLVAQKTDDIGRPMIMEKVAAALADHVGWFGEDVREVQAWQASAPDISDPEAQRGKVTIDELEANRETLDGYLKYTLDNMELEDEAPFYQIGNLVLTCRDAWPDRWKFDIFAIQDNCWGTMRRKTSKGRATIQVTGSNDEAGFKEAFRRVSDKVLQFKDNPDDD